MKNRNQKINNNMDALKNALARNRNASSAYKQDPSDGAKKKLNKVAKKELLAAADAMVLGSFDELQEESKHIGRYVWVEVDYCWCVDNYYINC